MFSKGGSVGWVDDRARTAQNVSDLPDKLRILTVLLRGTSVTDEDMVEMTEYAAASSVISLYLDDTRITDAGLAPLCRLESVASLWLSGTDISGEGLKTLQACKNLRSLHVGRNPRIGDPAMEHIKAMPALEGLHLIDTNVSGRGLEILVEMEQLEHVDLTQTWINDEDLACLRRLANQPARPLGRISRMYGPLDRPPLTCNSPRVR